MQSSGLGLAVICLSVRVSSLGDAAWCRDRQAARLSVQVAGRRRAVCDRGLLIARLALQPEDLPMQSSGLALAMIWLSVRAARSIDAAPWRGRQAPGVSVQVGGRRRAVVCRRLAIVCLARASRCPRIAASRLGAQSFAAPSAFNGAAARPVVRACKPVVGCLSSIDSARGSVAAFTR
jgi:hypothetical protein